MTKKENDQKINKNQKKKIFRRACPLNTKAQSAHTCVAVLTPDSLIVKYFMTLCIPDFKKIK